MLDIDKWQEIYGTVKRYKLRTALTAFGVFWGVFMLVALLGAGKGLQNGVLEGFGGLKNAVFIAPGGATSLPYRGLSKGRSIKFTDDDLAAIRQQVNNIDLLVAGNQLGQQFVERGEKNDSYAISGAPPETLALRGQRLLDGRFINPLDMRERRKVAVLGTRAREVLFAQGESPLGRQIQIKGIFFRVIGVFDAGRSGNFDQRAAETIYIPNSTLRYTFNQQDRIDQLLLTPVTGVRAEVIEQQVDMLLRERHQVHPNDPAPIATFNVQQRFENMQSLFAGMAAFSWLVAVGTIIAGVIGVGNIMLIVVKERTREIGIRKALGATPRSIVAMIVQESLVITGVAGYFGLVVGVFMLEGIGALLERATDGNGFFSNPEISFTTALLAIALLIVAGACASMMPASKAAKVDPVWALQEE